VDPVAFQIGPLTVRWYGICVALGFLAGFGVVHWRAPRKGIPRDVASDVVFWTMVGGILGARLWYVLMNLPDFLGRPLEIIRIDHGGLVFYGGFAGAVAAAALVCRVRHISPTAVADLVAPGLPLGHALGRIGCFLNGCCFGHPWDGAGGVTYAPETGALGPLFPIQLVASLMNLVLVGVLLLAEPRLKHPGQLLALYVALYAFARFWVEFGRGDYRLHVGLLTPGQLVCAVLFPVGAVVFLALRQRGSPAQ